VAGKGVLDLGSGSGLAAIAARKAGARAVLAADIDPWALAAVQLNAAANGVAVATTSADFFAAGPPPVDIILVGDLFYERPLAESALAFIESVHARRTQVLIGDPQRSYFPRGRFEKLAEYAVPVTRDLEDAEIKRTAVWRAGKSHGA
jgi:predicted nicotinamide N-methyase